MNNLTFWMQIHWASRTGLKPRMTLRPAGFFAATLAWGNRASIIRSCDNLMDRMDGAPAAFVREATDRELAVLDGFVHRTFQSEDAKRFVRCLRSLERDGGLEGAFTQAFRDSEGAQAEAAVPDMGAALHRFKLRFFADEAPDRTVKHVADPAKGSAAKRLCMYLRWMVRSNHRGWILDCGRAYRRLHCACRLMFTQPRSLGHWDCSREKATIGRR